MAEEIWLTTAQAAKESGYHVERIRELIREGKITARKFGPVWAVNRESLLVYVRIQYL
jgi:excisionase family DNA binding protein